MRGGESCGRLRGMKDLQLYQQLLGLTEPWYVAGVRLDVKAQEVEVTVAVRELVWGCPQCACRMHVHQWESRTWRHLDSCQFKTLIRADVPVVTCPEHGSQTVAVPWAEKYGRFSRLFERLAIDVLQECSVSAACLLLRISWDEADGIKQRAVARGLRRKQTQPVKRLGVDEKSAGRGQNYVTVVANLEPGQAATVEYVGDGRKQEALDAYWEQVPAPHRAGVEAVAMDLWDPYFNSTMKHVPGAAGKIVHDPYHLGRMLSEAVDKVRKAEHRVLMETDDDRLAGTKYVWLYGWENLPETHRERFDDLRGQRLKTSRAWAIKEMFRDFWTSETLDQGREFFRCWYGWAIRSRLEPIKRVARSFKEHLDNILTYFTHRITNAALEGLNNRIAGLVKKAFGYRNRERLKTDILFHLGGLDLYPSQ
jgi:transposase